MSGNGMKRLWLVRLGKNGEQDALALEKSLLSIGFGMTVDLSSAKDREAILAKMKVAFPDGKPGRQANFTAQVNQFANTMAVGDIVVSPLKTLSKLGIGEITGPYQQLENGRPARLVKWLATDVPREAFKQDLLFSFGAIMTVCEIRRNDALNRVLAVAKGGKDPGDGAAPAMPGKVPASEATSEIDATEAINLDQIARDQIERRISSVFTGHDFTNLIAAILTAQGYETHVSPPGPDAGIDIVAGRGALGFEAPRHRQLGRRSTCGMRLSQVGGRDDDTSLGGGPPHAASPGAAWRGGEGHAAANGGINVKLRHHRAPRLILRTSCIWVFPGKLAAVTKVANTDDRQRRHQRHQEDKATVDERLMRVAVVLRDLIAGEDRPTDDDPKRVPVAVDGLGQARLR